MSHDCVQKINAQLLAANTVISVAVSIADPERELIHIKTVKLDPTKPGRPLTLFARYCPICGEKL
jgi:hypothetical protein